MNVVRVASVIVAVMVASVAVWALSSPRDVGNERPAQPLLTAVPTPEPREKGDTDGRDPLNDPLAYTDGDTGPSGVAPDERDVAGEAPTTGGAEVQERQRFEPFTPEPLPTFTPKPRHPSNPGAPGLPELGSDAFQACLEAVGEMDLSLILECLRTDGRP